MAAITKKPKAAVRSSAAKTTVTNGRAAKGMTPRPTSSLRGILPTPPEVNAIVEEFLKDRPASPAFRLLQTEHCKMQYYFGGVPITYRETPKGFEVLAVGESECAKLWRSKKTLAQRRNLIHGYFEPWYMPESELP